MPRSTSKDIESGRLLTVPAKLKAIKFAFNLSYVGRRVISGKADSGVTFDHIYLNKAKGYYFIGRLVDRILLDFPSLKATRGRWSYIADEILRIAEEISPGGGEVDVVDLASGVSRYLVDLAKKTTKFKLQCLCLDKDMESLTIGRKISEGGQFRYCRTDLFASRKLINLGMRRNWRPNIAIATGLVEYLNDEALASLLEGLHPALTDRGFVILSSQINNPSRHLMETICRTSESRPWTLIYRQPENIKVVLERCGFSVKRVYIDDLKMYSILTAQK